MSRRARRGPGVDALEIGVRFFKATFEVMGHVAKSDGRVSEAEIAAARQVMAELRLNGAQIHAAIAHFTRGKDPDFDLEATMREFAEVCAHRPDLLRVFLEIQVRAALEGVDMQGPARVAIQKVAELLDVSRLELAHMEAVLRIRREQFRANARNGGSAGGQAQPRGMQLAPPTRSWRSIPRPPTRRWPRRIAASSPNIIPTSSRPMACRIPCWNTPSSVRSRSSRPTS